MDILIENLDVITDALYIYADVKIFLIQLHLTLEQNGGWSTVTTIVEDLCITFDNPEV